MNSIKRAFLSWAIIASVIPISTQSTVLHVPSNYATIQAGINTAVSGDTILVQPGIYVENINLGVENVTLGSSFLTTGDSSYIINTIIDGDSAGPVISITGGQDSTSLICGFTIQHGYAHKGGGIYCDSSSSPKIMSNFIINNSTEVDGGGIYLFGSSSIISNNHIAHNVAQENGAGISIWVGNPLVNKNEIYDNVVTDTFDGSGGGIACYSYSRARISHNSIYNNRSLNAAGLLAYNCRPIIDSNAIYENHAIMTGSGMSLAGDSSIVIGNVIKNNTGTESNLSIAGGIFCDCSKAFISNNVIDSNSAYLSSGGILCNFGSNIILEHNMIMNNYTSGNGGGLLISASSSMLGSRNTIINNSAVCRGGGVYSAGDYASITNSIIRDNRAIQSSPEIGIVNDSSLIIKYSNIQGGWAGEGNIDCDPFFCDPDNGDYHLAENSCCATAGDSGQYIGALGIGCASPACNYLPGDINSDGQRIGGDVTYGVRYFKSIGPQPPDSCFMDSTSNYLYVAGDVNGNCEFRGSDITRLVSFFKGNALLSNCHFFPTAP